MHRARREHGGGPGHRAPVIVAAALVFCSMALHSLRDSVLVPLLTGNPGYQIVVDGFWTPLVGWVSLALLLGALLAALVAAATWYRGQPGAGAGLPVPAAWIAIFFGVMVCLGVAVGVGAALSR